MRGRGQSEAATGRESQSEGAPSDVDCASVKMGGGEYIEIWMKKGRLDVVGFVFVVCRGVCSTVHFHAERIVFCAVSLLKSSS